MQQEVEVRPLAPIPIVILSHPSPDSGQPKGAQPIACQLDQPPARPCRLAVRNAEGLPVDRHMPVEGLPHPVRPIRCRDDRLRLGERQGNANPVPSIASATP